MAQEARATPYILYKRAYTYSRYDFYDAKPQSVKTPVVAKPSGISPNHPYQCSLVILSYYISTSHFFTADHL